jgi:hypothetical protein
MFSWVLLLGALILAILLGMGILNAPPAKASIWQLEEAPGQVVYQSRQTLRDQHGNTWQAIAFKRIPPQGEASFELRLVGFPGIITLDHTQPMTLTNSLGNTLTATDVSPTIFSAGVEPEANVGQYDLKPILPQLVVEIPLELTLPTLNDETVRLSVPPFILEEWQTVAHQG